VFACGFFAAIPLAPGLAQAPEFEPSLKMVVGEPLEGFGGRAVKLEARLRFEASDGQDPPVVTAGRLLLPRGMAVNGRRYAKCSGRSMRESQSTAGCPEDSFMGRSGPSGIDDPDGVVKPRFEFVNGGARRLWAFGTIYNPALVQEPMAIDVHGRRTPRPSFKLSFDVPQVLRVVAGVPVSLTHWPLVIGGRSYAPGYLTFDGRCPRGRKLGFRASLTYLGAGGTPVEATRRVQAPCLRSLPPGDGAVFLKAR